MRRLLAIVLPALAALGLGVRWTVRDSVDPLALVFYVLPLPAIGALFLVGGALGRRWWRTVVVTVGLVTLAAWFAQGYGFAKPQPGEWKFITWNVKDSGHPFAALVDLVRREKPDCVTLLECGVLPDSAGAGYETLLPGYRMFHFEDDRACLLRGEVVEAHTQKLPGRSRAVVMRVKLRDQRLRVLLVDLDSNIRRSRQPALAWIAREAAREPRTVVLGDFNTPLDSAWLDPMRGPFTAANEGRHAGFRETWFYGLPLLSLDQVWLSRDLRPVFTRRVTTLASDHAPVITNFSRRY